MARRDALRFGLIVVALMVGVVAAVPTGWSIGQWIVLENPPFTVAMARHWEILPGGLIMVAATAVIARQSRRALWFALPLLIVALVGLGAWRGVAAGVDAYREGPLNAAL